MEKKELQELFCTKIALENQRFKQKMLKKPKEVLLEQAYQIDTMINLYELLLEESRKMKGEVLKSLLVFPNLLAFLYAGWLKKEDSHMEELEEAVRESVSELAESYQESVKEGYEKKEQGKKEEEAA